MRRKVLWIALAAGLAVGCARHRGGNSPLAPTTQLSQPGTLSVSEGGPQAIVYKEVTSRDTVSPSDELRVVVDIVLITAPAGTISVNEAFWGKTQPIDDARQAATLAANGIRARTIKADQWGDAREQLGRGEGITSQPVQLSGGSNGTLTAAKFPHRTIFHFDAAGQMQGRTYDECEMIWGVHYAPETSGKPSVRMDVVPVVRSLRRQMRLSRTGQELGIDYIQPEVAYDLGIHTVLSIGSAIAIGPTAEGVNSETSIARAYLAEDTPGVLTERLIMMYPRLFRLDREAASKRNR